MMELSSLSDLPPLKLEAGYSVQSFKPEYANAWEAIILDSFQMTLDYGQTMVADKSFLPERVLFLCHEDRPVATASAWFREQHGEDTGYLHMVGLLSSYAGKGLGLQISLAALYRMREEGRSKAYLETDDYRIPALKTYYRLGFKPRIVHDNQIQRWMSVEQILEEN